MIIRPKRLEYDVTNLGPPNFSYGKYQVSHTDFDLKN